MGCKQNNSAHQKMVTLRQTFFGGWGVVLGMVFGVAAFEITRLLTSPMPSEDDAAFFNASPLPV